MTEEDSLVPEPLIFFLGPDCLRQFAFLQGQFTSCWPYLKASSWFRSNWLSCCSTEWYLRRHSLQSETTGPGWQMAWSAHSESRCWDATALALRLRCCCASVTSSSTWLALWWLERSLWTFEAAAFRLTVLKLQSSLLSWSSCSEGSTSSSRLVSTISAFAAKAVELSLFQAKRPLMRPFHHSFESRLTSHECRNCWYWYCCC